MRSAAAPCSRVRMRMTSETGTMKILPAGGGRGEAGGGELMIYQLHRENDALIEDVNAASPAYLLKRRRPTNGIDTRRAIDVHL